MDANRKFSEGNAILATLDPASQAAGTVVTSYVPVSNFHRIAALIDVGSVGTAGTVTATLVQATSSGGAGSKPIVNPITGANVTLPANMTVSNTQALIDALADWMDINNGFTYAGLSITVGTNAVLLSAALLGVGPRYESAAYLNQAGVVAVV